jgi:hypothetical protein
MQVLTEQQKTQRAQIGEQLSGLSGQRNELRSQLKELNRRRNELDEQRSVAPQAERPGIEARMAEIDARTARIDRQILSLDDQIAAGTERYTAVSSGQGAGAGAGAGAGQGPQTQVIRIPEISIPPMDFGGRSRRTEMRDIAGFMALEAVLLGLIGVVFWRMGMKRMRDQFERMFQSQSQQLSQMQNAVDVIGIEVERISEGQRYVAKVLSDGAPGSALPVGRKQV